jgi:hypothetical protein
MIMGYFKPKGHRCKYYECYMVLCQMIFDDVVKKCLEWAHNPKVRGSNPLPATKKIKGVRRDSDPFFFARKYQFPTLFPT